MFKIHVSGEKSTSRYRLSSQTSRRMHACRCQAHKNRQLLPGLLANSPGPQRRPQYRIGAYWELEEFLTELDLATPTCSTRSLHAGNLVHTSYTYTPNVTLLSVAWPLSGHVLGILKGSWGELLSALTPEFYTCCVITTKPTWNQVHTYPCIRPRPTLQKP